MANFSLLAKLGVDTKAFQKGLGKAKSKLKGFGKSILNVSNRLAKMGLGSAAAGFLLLSKRAISLGSELSDIAANTGFATEQFQVFRGALIDAGGSSKSMEKAIVMMQKAIVQGSEGMTTFTRAFDRLGLNVERLRQMKPEQQFEMIGRAIAGAEDQQGALTAAIEIFGQRNAGRLIEVFKRLDKEGYGKMAKDIEKAYGVMDEATQAALDRAADQIERFKNKSTIFVGELIAMEGSGAAFKTLGLQFSKVVSQFGIQLLSQVMKVAIVIPKVGQAAAKSVISDNTSFLREMEEFFKPSNNLLQGLADFNNEFYDEEIEKQQKKLEKARKDFQKNAEADGGLFGTLGGGAGGGGTSGKGKNPELEALKEKRLEMERELARAMADGDDARVEKLKTQLDLAKKIEELMTKGFDAAEAASLAEKLFDTRGDFVKKLSGKDLAKAANIAGKEDERRFQRMADGTFQEFINGKKGKRVTEEQLRAATEAKIESKKTDSILEDIRDALDGKYVNE